MNFTHSGMVRTIDGTVKIYFSPQNNINDFAKPLRKMVRLAGKDIFGFVSLNKEGGSVELKKLSKKLRLNFIEEIRREIDELTRTVYMYNMYISFKDLQLMRFYFGREEKPNYFYITRLYNNYFLVHVCTPYDRGANTFRDYVITDIVSHYDEYLRIVSEI